jgi:hypothetical protein
MKSLRPLILLLLVTFSTTSFALQPPADDFPKGEVPPSEAPKKEPKPAVDPLAPTLIGKYEHAYYLLAEPERMERPRTSSALAPLDPAAADPLARPAAIRRTSQITVPLGPALASILGQTPGLAVTAAGVPLRFFAAQFTLPIGPGSDTIPRWKAQILLQQKATEARHVVELNRTSLSPNTALNQQRISMMNWVVMGVFCPIHNELHWLGYGYHDTAQRFEVYSSSKSDAVVHEPGLGWRREQGVVPGPVPFPFSYWVAPVDEGGAVVESYDPPVGSQCGIKLLIAFSRRATNVTFGFQGPTISIVLLDDGEPPVDRPASPDATLPDLSDPIHYYAILATLLPTIPYQQLDPANWGTQFKIAVFGGTAAKVGRDAARVRGTALKDPSQLRRIRLPQGKALLLGAYNATKDENHWLVVYRDNTNSLQVNSIVQLLENPCSMPVPVFPWTTNSLGPWYTLHPNSGLDVKLHLADEPGAPTGVEFYFVDPH